MLSGRSFSILSLGRPLKQRHSRQSDAGDRYQHRPAAWMNTVYAELRQREISGEANNEHIVEYLQSTNTPSPGDEVDWSSAFVNWVVEKSGYKGTNSNVNRAWLSWGKPIYPPKPGCIAVFWRGSPSRNSGTQASILANAATHYHPRRQPEQRAISNLRRSTFLGCVWPS